MVSHLYNLQRDPLDKSGTPPRCQTFPSFIFKTGQPLGTPLFTGYPKLEAMLTIDELLGVIFRVPKRQAHGRVSII